MGTSKPFGGAGNRTPLVPSWLTPSDGGTAGGAVATDVVGDVDSGTNGVVDQRPAVEVRPAGSEFTQARTNFSRFVRSGGSDRRALGRAMRAYVGRATGGSRNAAARMGSSISTAGSFYNVLSDIRTQGLEQVLRGVSREELAGRPAPEILAALSDLICGPGGSVDEGIARDAFFETVIEFAELGITDLNALTVDQVDELMARFMCNSVEMRLIADIGTRLVSLPSSEGQVDSIRDQLRDFIREAVAVKLQAEVKRLGRYAKDSVSTAIRSIYESAWSILESWETSE